MQSFQGVAPRVVDCITTTTPLPVGVARIIAHLGFDAVQLLVDAVVDDKHELAPDETKTEGAALTWMWTLMRQFGDLGHVSVDADSTACFQTDLKKNDVVRGALVQVADRKGDPRTWPNVTRSVRTHSPRAEVLFINCAVTGLMGALDICMLRLQPRVVFLCTDKLTDTNLPSITTEGFWSPFASDRLSGLPTGSCFVLLVNNSLLRTSQITRFPADEQGRVLIVCL